MKDQTLTPDERHVLEERLAILGVIDREPTPVELALARGDVERFRRELRVDE